MQVAEIAGARIHYRLAGPDSGDGLVFVNSLGTDWRVWERVAGRFENRCRLLFYDTRGHGLSDLPPDPFSIEDHADDLAALLDELGIEHATICGLSVGGMIALGLADRRPSLVRALVLADTGHRIGTAETWNERIDAVHVHGLEAVADSVLARWLSDDFRDRDPAAAALWRNMLVRTPARGYTAMCAAIRDADLTRAAGSSGVPALCLCGSEDLATPPGLVRELSGLLGHGRYREIPGAAHLPTVEAPDTVADLIQTFLEEAGLVRNQ